MDNEQKNKIIRICATVADLYFRGELPVCNREDCPNRQILPPTANIDELRRQIRELLAEVSHTSLQEPAGAYNQTTAESQLMHVITRELGQPDNPTK